MKTPVFIEPFQIVRRRKIRRAKLYRLSLGLALSALLFLGLGGLMGCAETGAASVDTGQQVAAPFGYVGFCVRQPAECGGGTDAPRLASMTPSAFAELDEVNRHVNALPQTSDVALYDRDEWWAYPDARGGDCEDLAMMKRKLLIERGWPAEALLLAVVREWNGDGHAVLLVLSGEGQFVLDNKSPTVDRVADAPYRWVKVQSPRRPFIWVNADPGLMRTGSVSYPPLGEKAPFLTAVQEAAR